MVQSPCVCVCFYVYVCMCVCVCLPYVHFPYAFFYHYSDSCAVFDAPRRLELISRHVAQEHQSQKKKRKKSDIDKDELEFRQQQQQSKDKGVPQHVRVKAQQGMAKVLAAALRLATSGETGDTGEEAAKTGFLTKLASEIEVALYDRARNDSLDSGSARSYKSK